MRSINPHIKQAALLLILGILVILVIIFRRAVFIYLVAPVASVFWLVWRVFTSVSQGTYWMLVLACFFILLVYVFAGNSGTSRTPGYQKQHDDEHNRSFYHWHSAISEASTGSLARQSLRVNLQDLLINTIAHVENLSPLDVRESLCSKQSPLPPRVYDYLFPQDSEPPHSGRFWRRVRRKKTNDLDETTVVLDWIETYLEEKHAT